MKYIFIIIFFVAVIGCDSQRVYEEHKDFSESYWLQTDTVFFQFEVRDTSTRYNLFCNLRNTSLYPYARLFFEYSLSDSGINTKTQNLVSVFLFDTKTGEPHGYSGVGDVFDHRISLLANYKFSHPGWFNLRLTQEMRLDTLPGIRAVGYRLEKAKVK